MNWFSNIPTTEFSHDESSTCLSHEDFSTIHDEEEEENRSHWNFHFKSVPNPESATNEDTPSESTKSLLHPAYKIAMHGSMQASCSQFSADGNWLAVGLKAGFVQIHNSSAGGFAFTLDTLKGGQKKRSPCTCLCIRPCHPGDSSYNVVLTCDLDGNIHYWHITSGMHLGISKEIDNSIYAVDFHENGLTYATGGSDYKIRVYDAATRHPLRTLREGNGKTTCGHSNRIFAVKWHPLSVNTLLSGGWDNTIQIWDTRSCQSVRSIFGPRLHGDALDVHETGDFLLTGSWRNNHQLQEWDVGTGKLVQDVPIQHSHQKSCRVYAAKYGKGIFKNLIAFGGSGTNETCLISRDTFKSIAKLPQSEKAIHATAFSRDGKFLSVTTLNDIYVFDLRVLKLA